MSKPIFTTDLGMISPKTAASAGSKPGVDTSATADAFEGALSTAVARQRENEARTQAKRDEQTKAERDQTSSSGDRAKQATGSQERRPARQRDDRAEKVSAPSDPQDDASAASAAERARTRDGAADQSKKVPASSTEAGNTGKVEQKSDAAPDSDEETAAASTDADPNAAVAAIDGGAQSDEDASEGQAESGDAEAQITLAAAPTAVPLPPSQTTAAVVDPEGDLAPTDAVPSAGGQSAATPVAPALAASTPAAPAPTAPAADLGAEASPVQPTAPTPTSDGETLAASAPTIEGQASDPSALTASAAIGASDKPAGVAPNTGLALDPEAATAQTAADQAAQIALNAALAQSQSARQAVAAPTTASAQASAQPTAPQALKPFIPAESSSVSSLKDAIDISATVTYTASAASQSENSGFGAQSGAGYSLGGNANGASGRPAGTPAIVTQDLALLSQTIASDAEALPKVEAAPVIVSAPDEAPLVEIKTTATSSSPVAQTAQTHSAFEAPTAQTPTPVARAHPVLLPLASQITAGMSTLAKNGGGEINIHLQPANLGRVDVSMKIDEDGRMTATITADRQDTLDLLRRDSYALERSLADAGMKTDGGGLQFSLRGESGQRDRDSGGGRAQRGLAQIAPDQEINQASPTRRTSGLSRLDMRI